MGQGAEFIFLEKFRRLWAVLPVDLHRGCLHADLDVGLYGHQFAAQAYVVFGLPEHLLLSRRKLVDVVVDALDGSVPGHQLAGSDFADPLHSGYVVGRVSADCQHVDDLDGGLDAVFRADFLNPDDLVFGSGFPRLVLLYVFFYELPVVLVRRDHEHVQTFTSASLGQGPDHVVGFEAGHEQGRNVQGGAESAQGFQRVDDKLWSGLPVRLVLGIHLVPEGPSRRVERNCEVFRLLTFQQLQQVLGEPEKD